MTALTNGVNSDNHCGTVHWHTIDVYLHVPVIGLWNVNWKIEHTWRRDLDLSVDFTPTCIIQVALTVRIWLLYFHLYSYSYINDSTVDCHTCSDDQPLATNRLILHQGAENPEHLPSGIFLVDRLVTTRPSKAHKVGITCITALKSRSTIIILMYSGIVLWEGYPKEEATWVLDTDVTDPAVECVM